MVGKKKKREGGREDVVVEHYSETNYHCILHSFKHLQALLRHTNWATRSVKLCKLCSLRTSPPTTLQDLQGTKVT